MSVASEDICTSLEKINSHSKNRVWKNELTIRHLYKENVSRNMFQKPFSDTNFHNAEKTIYSKKNSVVPIQPSADRSVSLKDANFEV